MLCVELKLYVLLCLVFSQEDTAATSGNPQRHNLRLPSGATTKARDLDEIDSELGHARRDDLFWLCANVREKRCLSRTPASEAYSLLL